MSADVRTVADVKLLALRWTLPTASLSGAYLPSHVMTPVFPTVVPFATLEATFAVTSNAAVSPLFANPSLPSALSVRKQSTVPLDPTGGDEQAQPAGALTARNSTFASSGSVKCGVSAVGDLVLVSATLIE